MQTGERRQPKSLGNVQQRAIVCTLQLVRFCNYIDGATISIRVLSYKLTALPYIHFANAIESTQSLLLFVLRDQYGEIYAIFQTWNLLPFSCLAVR